MPAAVNVRPLPTSSPRRDAIGRIKSLMAFVSSFWVKPRPRLNTERRKRAGGQTLAIGAGELEGLRENAADLRIERLHQLAARAQMARLLEVGALPNVTMQVVPFSAGGHAAMDGPFVILSFPEQLDPEVVYIESTRSGVYLEQQSDVHWYAEMFERLVKSALNSRDSAALITGIARTLA